MFADEENESGLSTAALLSPPAQHFTGLRCGLGWRDEEAAGEKAKEEAEGG